MLDRSDAAAAERKIHSTISSTFINLPDRLSDRLNKPEGSRRESANGRKVSKTQARCQTDAIPSWPRRRKSSCSLCFLGLGDIMNCGVRIIQAGLRHNGKCSTEGLVGSAPARLHNNPTAAENPGVTHTNVHLHPGSSGFTPGPEISCQHRKKTLKQTPTFVFAHWKKKKTDSHSWEMLK